MAEDAIQRFIDKVKKTEVIVMRKDINWVKKELNISSGNAKSYKGNTQVVSIDMVNRLIGNMIKQETISEEFLRTHGDWVNMCHTGEKVRAVRSDILKDVLMPEPPEIKIPEIPRFVADWIEEIDVNKNYLFKFIMRYLWNADRDTSGIPQEIIDWIFKTDDNILLTLRLIKNDTDYTIAKETKYRVKLGKGYFGGFNELKVTLILNDQPGSMDHVIIYYDKKVALKIAEEIGGKVEDVTE